MCHKVCLIIGLCRDGNKIFFSPFPHQLYTHTHNFWYPNETFSMSREVFWPTIHHHTAPTFLGSKVLFPGCCSIFHGCPIVFMPGVFRAAQCFSRSHFFFQPLCVFVFLSCGKTHDHVLLTLSSTFQS